MSKWERRQFFERLIQLRALYALRGDDDSTAVMTIPEALSHIAHLLESPAALAMVIGPLDEEQGEPTGSNQTANQ